MHYELCIKLTFLPMHHTPNTTNGMLNNCPISNGMPCSKATCSFFRNSMKKRKVKMVARQKPK